MSYESYFQFKKGMSIESDFGHQFFTESGRRRLNVRSIFLYDLSPHWRIGAGMGFFWDYNVPNVSQELRLAQELQYHKDFGSTLMRHRLRVEEQITQDLREGDRYNTRVRYELDLTIPTSSGVYFGLRDEIFSNLSSSVASASTISMNRLSGFVGFDTFSRFRVEAQVIAEDTFSKDSDGNSRSWVFRVAALHTL